MDPSSVKKVGVIGLGKMGADWVANFLEAGFDVVGFDVSAEMFEKSKKQVAEDLNWLKKKKHVDDAGFDAETCLAKYKIVESEDAFIAELQSCQIFLEAIFEDITLKCDMLQNLTPKMPDGIVLWSNTSSLSVLTMASIAVGLLISAVFKKSEYALMVVPLVLIPQIVLGGTLVPLTQWRAGAAALTVSRWATESLFDQEAKAIERRPVKKHATPSNVAGQVLPTPKPSQVWLEPFRLKSGKTSRNLVILGIHGLLYMLLAGLLLRWKTKG